MSMLVGVRGQSRESEGAAALREGIIQQPGSFYNGNPSSVIWGNSPAAPLWGDESGASPFSSSAQSTFDISKQPVRKEEKEKDGGGMVGGEGRASSKGRRHVARAHITRSLHPNPTPSSPFAFGFPPQPPPLSTPSSASGFGPPPVPTVVPSGGSFVAFGSSSNYIPGFQNATCDLYGTRTGAIPSAQDERMEDIEEVIPAMANLGVNEEPSDSKFSARPEEYVKSSQDISSPWASGSDVSEKFSASGINNSTDSSIDRKDPSGVFVFGAKPPTKAATPAPQKPSVVQAPVGVPARPRTVKVKRGVSAAKGKGIAAGNGAFGAPPKGLHVDGSQSVSGECSFSQPNLGLGLGLGISPVHNAECSSDDSSSQRFASSSSLPMPLHEDSVSDGLHASSPEMLSPSESGLRNFVFTEIGKGSHSSGESNARSEISFVPHISSEEASEVVVDNILPPSAFSRVASSNRPVDETCSSSQSLNASIAGLTVTDDGSKKIYGKREFVPGHIDVKGRVHSVEDLSKGFTHKLSLGSLGFQSDLEMTADSDVGSKPGKFFNTETVGSSKKETPAPNSFPPVAKEDGDKLQSSSSSPAYAAEFSKIGKEPTIDIQRPSLNSFNVQSEPTTTTPAHSEPFVFGASRPQAMGGIFEAPSASNTLKFSAKATPSVSSSTGGGCVSRSASISVSDLLAFKQKDSGTYDSNPASQVDTDAVTSSFNCFNLGAAKPSVRADDAVKPEGFGLGVKMPTSTVPSFSSGVKTDSDGDSSSYVSAATHFVFSAGSGSTSSSQATAPMTPTAKGNGAVAGAPEIKVQENLLPIGGSVSSQFFDAQSRSRPKSTSSATFEFRANSGDGAPNGKGSTVKKKSHKAQSSAPRRHSRSSATSKEERDSGTFIIFRDVSGNPDDGGSPMDFSPQRLTPPAEIIPDSEQTSKQTSWSNSQSGEREGLDGDEWAHYDADVVNEDLRNAASDLTLGSEKGGHSAWEGIAKVEDESFWWGGKDNSLGKVAGRNGKWKRATFDETQVPLGGRDNTWADIKIDNVNEPGSAASSSTPSVESSASSTGWGHFTFTAGSSPNFSSTTSLLRRHARRIQREKPSSGLNEVKKSTGLKVRGDANPSGQAGLKHGGGGSASATGGTTTMKRPVFSFDGRSNNPGETGKAGKGGQWASEQLKAPSTIFSSRSNSWSTDSSSSFGSLPRADGVGPASPNAAGAAATEQVCERWRLRGNQAYAIGDFPKAEEYYSRGASSVPPNETSQSCIRASMLCYSNRAATRMVVGRMREALADCMRAMAVDPNFLRVRLRAASCHLALGETDAAALAYKECIRRAKEDEQPDAKVSSEASEGLRKALQVDEYLDRATEILANWSSGDTPTALRQLNEVLLSSPHSERALELKCRALLLLRKFDEVVQLCEQSLITAERNHPSGDSTLYQMLLAQSDMDTAKNLALSLKVWRWQLSAKAKYHLGRLEDALETLQKLEAATSVVTSEKVVSTGTSPNADPSALSIASIRDLLRHKAAGNEAFQNGKHAEAVEHYSAALACNGDSRPFNAVCFCNRAAASQALGNIGDAIADCSRAIALDPKYAKAISRRATLHEKVRDYGQSCHDLQRLITLLEGQQQQAKGTLSPGRVGRCATTTQQDLRQARDRLEKAEDEMKKGHPLDHYMILGLEPACSSNEIKKAYRKAALRHHPDKAGQFLARNEGGDDGGLWKEVGDEVRRDAERLFKLIGEAYAILSDTQKRARYDAEEEFRKLRTRSSTAMGGLSEMYRNMERGQGGGGRRSRDTRDRWDTWNGYNQRWQSGPDAAQPDTYARRGRFGSNNSSRSNGEGGRYNTEYDWDDI